LVRLGYLRLSLDRVPYVNVRYSANTAWTNPDFDPELPAVLLRARQRDPDAALDDV
jgi:hypothetical protein